jgi:hypothetical protein
VLARLRVVKQTVASGAFSVAAYRMPITSVTTSEASTILERTASFSARDLGRGLADRPVNEIFSGARPFSGAG